MTNDDKIKLFKEYQLMKQLRNEKIEVRGYVLETSEQTVHNNKINDLEKHRIGHTVKNLSRLCGWILSDHVVMLNGIKLVFNNKDYTEKKEIVIHTDEQNHLVIHSEDKRN